MENLNIKENNFSINSSLKSDHIIVNFSWDLADDEIKDLDLTIFFTKFISKDISKKIIFNFKETQYLWSKMMWFIVDFNSKIDNELNENNNIFYILLEKWSWVEDVLDLVWVNSIIKNINDINDIK